MKKRIVITCAVILAVGSCVTYYVANWNEPRTAWIPRDRWNGLSPARVDNNHSMR